MAGTFLCSQVNANGRPVNNTNTTGFPVFNNAFNKFYRGYGRGVSDTLKLDILNSYSIKLNLRSENKIQIVYLKNGEILKDFELECNLNADSYLYIENNNSKITGIPYLFGGVDIKKIRLTNDNLNNLIIEEVNHSSGGLLLFLGDSKTWNYRNYYKRIW